MPDAPLRLGAYGAAVVRLQEFLGQLGTKLPASEVDRGFFGPYTRQAVQQYQRNNGLPPSGELDPKTAALVGAVVRGSGPVEMNPSVVLSVDRSPPSETAIVVPGIVFQDEGPPTPDPGFQIPDTLTESDLTARLRSGLTTGVAGSTADAIVWQDRGDDVVVHLSTLQVRLAPPALFAAVELESDQTGRQSVIVRFVFGDPQDPAGLFATTDEVVRGNSLLATRWGPIFRDLIWSALTHLSSDHAAERGLAPLRFSVGGAGLQLAASQSIPLPQRVKQIPNRPAPADPTTPR
jgi:peptidoglycan hydrolase-like protein with peptidoglycan-binding domain